MKKIVATLLGLWMLSALALAEDVAIRDGVPERYTVRDGDTLWGISAMFLRDPWRWPEVWEANPQIDNPHLIYPGDVIALVYVDGQPRLTIERNGQGVATSGPAAGGGSYPASGRIVKLVPRIKEIPHQEAIAAIPLDIVNTFLARTRVVQPGELEAAPYVLAGHERRLLSGGGDDFYVRGALQTGVDFYGVYRQGAPYVDDATGEVLGIKAEDIGSGQVKATDGDVATLQATRSEREIRVGDRLLVHEERRLDPTFFPVAPDADIRGKLIDVEGGVSQVGTLSVVAINRGLREGLDTGNLLAIYKKGEAVKDRMTGETLTLPSKRAGLLMVFRAFEKMSFGLVLTADRPLAVGDEVRLP